MSTLYTYKHLGADTAHGEEHRSLEEGFDKLDSRERLCKAKLFPSAPAFVGGIVAVQSEMGGFSTMRFQNTLPQSSAAAQIQVYRGYGNGAALEVTWVPEVVPVGTMNIVVDYTFILARAGLALGVFSTTIQRTYTVPSTVLVQRDRVPIDGIVPRADDILGIVITRRSDLAGDTYDGLATRRLHIIEASVMLQGADGEDV